MLFWIFLYNWNSLDVRLNSHLKAWIIILFLREKKNKTFKSIQRKLFRKNLKIKDCCSRLKATKTIKRKAFCRQRIPESTCAKEESVDMDILITSKNGDRRIMQSVRIVSGPVTRKRKGIQSR